MSPTPSSNSKKRIQPKRASTTPAKVSKKSTPKQTNKDVIENKNSDTPSKNSKSKTPTRSGSKRKQPFKVIVSRDSKPNSKKTRTPSLRISRKYQKKGKTTLPPRKNFRILITKRVKVITDSSQQSVASADLGPDLDTTKISTPSPEGKVPTLKKDQSTLILDGIHQIDLEELQKKQDESISEIQSNLKMNIGLPDKDTKKSFRSFVKPNSTIIRNKSKIISPTKSFGPIPYDYRSKYDDEEGDSLNGDQADDKNDITIGAIGDDDKQDIQKPDIPTTDFKSPILQSQQISEPFAQEIKSPQIDIEPNQSFAELELEFDLGDFANIPDQSGFINPTENTSNNEKNLDNDILNNDKTQSLGTNALEIGDLFSPNNNTNMLETSNSAQPHLSSNLETSFDITSHSEPQTTRQTSQVGTNPLDYLLNADANSTDQEPRLPNSISEANSTPFDSLKNTQLDSENSESNLPTTNLFSATGFSSLPTQPDIHTNIDEPSNSDNSLSQPHNISQTRKYFAIFSDDENEQDVRESPTTVKRKQILKLDASEDEDLKEDMDFLKEQDILDNRTRDRRKLSKTAILIEKMKNRKFEFDETDSYEENSADEYEESDFDTRDQNVNSEAHIIRSESSEDKDSLNSFIDEVELNEDDKQELANLSMDLSMQSFSIEQSFKILAKALVYNYFDSSFLENVYSSPGNGSYYINAFKHINRRIDSYKYSLIQSSAWNKNFLEHISNSPFHFSSKFSGEVVCQACKKDKHFSTFKIQLSGNYYDRKTLKDNLSERGDEVFYLGKFCFGRAEIYHQLHHFVYHLQRKIFSVVKLFNLEEGEEVERAMSKLESDGYIIKWFNEIELIIDSANKKYSTESLK